MVTGSCLCGAVRFSVRAIGIDIYKCHCSKCRKNFGGASSAAAFVGEADFRWIQGEDNLTKFELTPKYSKQFCVTCGSIAPARIPGRSIYWVPAGLFDDASGLQLARHVYVDSKAEWEVLDDELERLPEGFEF